jgi:hypothetical protein
MTEDGIHNFGYVSDPERLSPNGAKKLLPPSTPAKFDYLRRHPQEPKRVFDFGTVAHKMVLGEGDQFLILDPEIHGLKKDGTVADNPRATATWKEAETNSRAEGLVPIHIEDYRKAVEMATVVHQHETAGRLLAEGEAERWLYWHESGQGLRTRLDWMCSRGKWKLVEYKTCVDASPEMFPLAAAFAVAGARALGLDEDPDYVIVAQQKDPPYEVCVHDLDHEAFEFGRRAMRQAITTYQRCMEADEWPSYPLGINSISLPLWAINDEEMEIPA